MSGAAPQVRPRARRSLLRQLEATFSPPHCAASSSASIPYFTRSQKNVPSHSGHSKESFLRPARGREKPRRRHNRPSNLADLPWDKDSLHSVTHPGAFLPLDQRSTSEYGTASEASWNSKEDGGLGAGDGRKGARGSRLSSLPPSLPPPDSHNELAFSDLESDCPMAKVGWDSDFEDAPSDNGWESDAEVCHMDDLRRRSGARLLRNKDVAVFIPQANSSGYSSEDFHLRVLEDPMYIPRGGTRVHHASPVVSLEPHGVKFLSDQPALIILPLLLEPSSFPLVPPSADSNANRDPQQLLSCLYSNTPEGVAPRWERLPRDSFSCRGNFLVVYAHHFSLFTAVLEEPCPQASKRVRCRVGGRVRVASVPGVEVVFPRGVLEEDLDVTVRVWFDGVPGVPPFQSDHRRVRTRRNGYSGVSPAGSTVRAGEDNLASPVVMVEPHGYHFADPVTVQLPIPHYWDIRRTFGEGASISVWQSPSSEQGSPLAWERLDVPLQMGELRCGLVTAAFPVSHFSFFKVLWDTLSSSLYEAKMGMSYFYPYIHFSMMCQAFMEENSATNRFALEVICYRSDRRLPETSNYKHRVGSSVKPKLVRPGRILVRLKSQMFEGDTEAGEEPDMTKEELDFRGRDFEKQYACRFKPGVTVDRGTFGKVVVERVVQAGKHEPLFEFNLYKSGFEGEASTPDNSDRWSIVAVKELAGNLLITEDNNWKRFAQSIGFTKNEIKNKLQHSPDPFVVMMNMYQERGGTPEEFMNNLHAVSRELRVGGMSGSNSSRESRSSNGSSGKGSGSRVAGNNPQLQRRSWTAWWRGPGADDSDSASASQQSGASRKRSRSSGQKQGGSNGSSAKRQRRQFSDVSETISSSSEDSGADGDKDDDEDEILSSRSAEKYKNDQRKLSSTHLWNLSAHMNNVNWRALGRTLGLDESILLNIEHAHKATGFRECAYQMLLEWNGRKPRKCTFGNLYTALVTENMNGVAKQMSVMNLNESGRS